MSSTQIPEGHLGNLTKEQVSSLKQMWITFYALHEKGASAIQANGTDKDANNDGKKAEAIAAEERAESKKLIDDDGGFDKFHSTFWASPNSEHPDAIMLRFLRARKWDVDRAFAMLTCMIKWRIELDVDSIIDRGEEVLNKDLPGFDFQMKSGKAYLHGADKNDRPCFYIHVQIHQSKQQTFEALRTFTIYSMETGRMFLAPPSNQCCLIFDLTNFGLKNMDWPFIQFLVKAFEAYYPETLGTLIIHKAPWVFSGIWRVLCPLLDPVVRNKVAFTRNDKDLLEFIDASQLPKGMGGKEDWEWQYTDCAAGENDRFKDEKAKAFWLEKRASLRDHLEETTRVWMKTEDEKATQDRNDAVLEYRIASIEADPYLRPRTVYHRHNNLREDGTVEWDYKSDAGDQKFGVPVSEMKRILAEGNTQSGTAPQTNGTPPKAPAVTDASSNGRAVGGFAEKANVEVEHVEHALLVPATA